jgi:hypothetical protein
LATRTTRSRWQSGKGRLLLAPCLRVSVLRRGGGGEGGPVCVRQRGAPTRSIPMPATPHPVTHDSVVAAHLAQGCGPCVRGAGHVRGGEEGPDEVH